MIQPAAMSENKNSIFVGLQMYSHDFVCKNTEFGRAISNKKCTIKIPTFKVNLNMKTSVFGKIYTGKVFIYQHSLIYVLQTVH